MLSHSTRKSGNFQRETMDFLKIARGSGGKNVLTIMIIQQIPWRDPLEAASLMADLPRLALLDSAMPHDVLGRWSYLAAAPLGVFRVTAGTATWNGEAVGKPPLAALRDCLARYASHPPASGASNAPPFTGGAIGMLAYEAGQIFENINTVTSPAPQIDFPFYDRLIAFDVIDKRAFVIAPDEAAANALATTMQRPAAPPLSAPQITAWHDNRTREEYKAEISRAIAYIRNGDIFQVNLSHRFSASSNSNIDALATYRALRQSNPAPFSALLVNDSGFTASTSPERFVRLADGQVEARPIKGTARRDVCAEIDASLAKKLADSEKDRAENIMIVDLLRNDLSRVCIPGSVRVPVLCGIESYASVHHLTSVITGHLREGNDICDLIQAAFPGGSITGAPKIRAMEIIAEMEKEPRGIYCGSIGWIGFNGNADFNIAIRTLTCDGTSLSVRAGGGITLLSDPDLEYEETLIKAERLLAALPSGNSATRTKS